MGNWLGARIFIRFSWTVLLLGGCASSAVQDLAVSSQKAATAVTRLTGSQGGKSNEDSLVEKFPSSSGGKSREPSPATSSSSSSPTTTTKGQSKGSTTRLNTVEKKSISPDFTQTPEEVQKMLIRSNPDACSATSDASYTDIAKLYGELAVSFAGMYVQNRIKPDKEISVQMREFKSILRELSRNTNWMPHSVERMVGEAYYKYHKYEPYKPKRKELALLNDVVGPAFEAMKLYSKEVIKTDIDFELHVVRDDVNKSPSMLPGGLMIVPSAMLTALSDASDADQVAAFMVSHEFSHALRRHVTKLTQLRILDALTAIKQFKEMVGVTRSGFDQIKNPIEIFRFTLESASSLVNQTCKTVDAFKLIEHNQEFEADVCGTLLLKQFSEASKRDYSAVRGFTTYMKMSSLRPPSTSGGNSCLTFSTHPANKERLQKLTSYEIRLDLSTTAVPSLK